ncbi:MAG: DUF3185 family protein [Elusimicrobia bacterium]|nr:DUF3185 family protein [Elusimicrobiota bacterium]MBK7208576.1 DUF3185 family protein [Elusimicrobiota bacterium]MBK7545321.1 DUF3185 family protein [Elusimicrobiota bacterium]MBK7575662.1 DUF3185 family protein [Elusimicrobiota bacterium]MBK7688568.1 DUF3185 family protein [Elusimicrobiota bacterium]
MSTHKIFSIALLVGGGVLIMYGMNASDSFRSDVSRFFTGSPTNKTVWLFVGGIVVGVLGLMGLSRGK